MSFKEIKELRQVGKLDEALQMANQALETEPENIWNKRAAAWVYYDFLKQHAQLESYDSFKEHLIKIKELQLPQDEKMVFDNCAWQIGKIVFALQNAEHVDYGKINDLFEIIRDFHFTKPSKAFSFIYKAFHKGYQNWSNYLNFADWWNFNNLLSEDYIEEEYKGIKIMSMAEQAYITYAKKLLEGEPSSITINMSSDSQVANFIINNGGYLNKSKNTTFNKSKIKEFLPKLDRLIEKHPNFLYPNYFKAKLLLANGDNDNVLSGFISFAMKKRNDFWVWQLMAEVFEYDNEIRFACYCKALSLKTRDEYLVKIRQTFIEMLIKMKMYDEAKTEIQKVIITREEKEWKIPNQILKWTEQEWYKSTTAKRDNQDLYFVHIKQAEEILFQDIPEEIIVVEFVNENKRILNFVKNKYKYGFFTYSDYLSKPKIGDILQVRFDGDGQNGFYKLLSAKKSELNQESDAVRTFEGLLKIIEPLNFGLVDGVYIDSKLISKSNLSFGEYVNGRAIISFNKKKNEWGWKAFEIKLINLGHPVSS